MAAIVSTMKYWIPASISARKWAIARSGVAPDPLNDLDGLRERGLPPPRRQKRQAKIREFVGIPAITQAQNQSASG